MRRLADRERIARFMRALGRAADSEGACYFTGGAAAVLLGWRRTTIAVDIRLVPETDGLLRAIERGHDQDLGDVRAMVERDLVDPARALAYFEEMGPELFRSPAIEARAFRRRVEEGFRADP